MTKDLFVYYFTFYRSLQNNLLTWLKILLLFFFYGTQHFSIIVGIVLNSRLFNTFGCRISPELLLLILDLQFTTCFGPDTSFLCFRSTRLGPQNFLFDLRFYSFRPILLCTLCVYFLEHQDYPTETNQTRSKYTAWTWTKSETEDWFSLLFF